MQQIFPPTSKHVILSNVNTQQSNVVQSADISIPRDNLPSKMMDILHQDEEQYSSTHCSSGKGPHSLLVSTCSINKRVNVIPQQSDRSSMINCGDGVCVCVCVCVCASDCVAKWLKPHQPERHIFPRRQFGKSKFVSRAFPLCACVSVK